MNRFIAAVRDYFTSAAFERTKETLLRGTIAAQKGLDCARAADFLAPLLIRLYLAPVFWMAGSKKIVNFSSTAEWFGNSEGGLGLPLPYLLTALVAGTELLGAIFLLFGFAVRWVSIPLMVTMVTAGWTVHWKYGWLAIAGANWPFASERTLGALERLEKVREILQQYGDYAWLTEKGSFVVLNNGIEFAATYFVLLLALFFAGGGRYVSVDYWLRRRYMP
jgi:uncharacterized membrane protein YphA (DoxX/SURF4 family)